MSNKIQVIKDRSGNNVLPVTHERAVLDSNGVNLENKLGNLSTKGELDQLRQDSRYEDELTNLNYEVGYVIYSDGTISGSSAYNHAEFSVEEGTVIKLRTDGSSAAAIIAAYDSNDVYQKDKSVAGTGTVSDYEYTVPSGVAKVIVTVYNNASYKHIYILGELFSKPVAVANQYTNTKVQEVITQLGERIDNETDCYGEAINLQFETGYFVYSTGDVSASESYLHTQEYLPVKFGEKYAFLCDQGTTVGSVMAYDKDYKYIKDLSLPGSGSYSPITYVVPDGVSFLRFTINNTDNLTKFVSRIYTARKTVKDAIDSKDYSEGIEMETGVHYQLEENYHKTDWIMQANFREIGTGFTYLYVGKGWLYYRNGMTVRITPTHVQTLYNNTNWYISEEHGLTINDYLDVRVEAFVDKTDESASYTGDGDATFVKITLFDGVSEYTIEKAFFTGGGKPFVRIDGADCKCNFYYWNTGLKRDLWCYGDSYFSIAQTRWPYWIITRGFGALWNGNPGANSRFMWANFTRDLQHGNPRKVFWCLGMNDKDASDAANANWSKFLQQVKDICRLRGIELILATIPIVPSTEADNTYKNQVVRASGYKYVDFADAVMKPDGTGWYDGMMMDATHPSKTGARCLANAAMKLFISYKKE